MADWREKVVLITGGSAGLGKQVARAFLEKQATVVLVARDENRLREACQEIGASTGGPQYRVADVTDPDEARQAIESVIAEFGKLDVLVNNVGVSTRSALSEARIEKYQQSMKVNFDSVVNCTLPALSAIEDSQGHIVNIGSLAAKTPWPYMGPYVASKHAVAGWTGQLRLELDDRVHVLLVCPGPMDRTDAGRRYQQTSSAIPEWAKRPGGGANLKRIDPFWLAQRIVKACDRRNPELIVPGKSRLLFILSAISPRFGMWLLKRKSRERND